MFSSGNRPRQPKFLPGGHRNQQEDKGKEKERKKSVKVKTSEDTNIALEPAHTPAPVKGLLGVIPNTVLFAEKKKHGKKVVPGPRPRMGVGNIPDVLPDMWTAAKRLYREYGGIVKLRVFDMVGFVITEPDYLETILALPDKGAPRQEIAPDGIFLADGPVWEFARKVLQGRFIHKNMHEFVPLFIRKTQAMLAPLDEKSKGQEAVPVLKFFQEKMFEVICEAAFGYKVEDWKEETKQKKHSSAKLSKKELKKEKKKKEKDAQYVSLYQKFIVNFDYAKEEQVSIARQIRNFAHTSSLHAKSNKKFNTALRRMEESVGVILQHKIEQRKKGISEGEHGKDLLDLMLDEKDPTTGQTMSEESIRGQIITLLVAGHKTSALLMAWSIYLISQHPDVEEKLVEEIADIFGGEDREATLSDLTKMKYADQVIRETIRLYPPAQSVIRAVGEEPVEVGGYTLPKKSHIFINVYDIHRMQQHWGQDSEFFDPDRFTPENMSKFHPYQFIPFGGGARSCLGNLFAVTEVKVVMTTIYRKYSPRKVPGHKIRIGADPCLPLDDIQMYFDPIDPDLIKPNKPKEEKMQPKKKEREKDIIEKIPQAQWGKNPEAKAMPILIFYGSNHGTCKDFANKLAVDAKNSNFIPKVMSFDEINLQYDFSGVFSKASKKKKLNATGENDDQMVTALVVVSSYNGKPPDNAARFYTWLTQVAKVGVFDILQYAVFGVGNTQWYSTYQAVPKTMDERFEELGGTRLLDFGFGDENGDLEGDFVGWRGLIWPVLREEFGMNFNERLLKSSLHENFSSAPPFKIVYCNDPASNPNNEGLCKGYGECKVIVNEELQLKPDRSTRRVGISCYDAKTKSRFEYKAGDHLEVWPQNQFALVKNMARALGVKLDQHFRVEPNTPGSLDLPSWVSKGDTRVYTVEEVLTNYCDLSAQPTRTMLQTLAQYATDPTEKGTLELWGSSFTQGLKEYNRRIVANKMILSEVLNTFPSVELPFVDFLAAVPTLSPRFYSISSSPLLHPVHIYITCGVVSFETPTTRIHKGLASTYVSQKEAGKDVLTCRVRHSEFRLPENLSAPIICTATGTGLAPFMAFLEEREYLRKQGLEVGDVILFFGCRSKSEDYIYEKELGEYLKSKTLTSLHVAFSRDQEEKIYVQHIMHQQKAMLYDMVEKKGAIFYICGDAQSMQLSVFEVWQKIYKEIGNMSPEESAAHIRKLQSEQRYVVDVWG